jgi:hypothetical protein
MGSQKPVLCSDSPKFTEIKRDLDDVTYLSLPTHHIGKWSAAMGRIMEDETLRNRLATALFEYGKRTTWEKTAARHLAVFEGKPPQP